MTSKRPNKFADLISAAREPEETIPPVMHQEPVATQPPTTPPDEPRRGRPATGKRSNPDFEQVTAYIRKDTNIAIKIALLQEGNKRDFSDLVEELLTLWLRERT